MHHSVAGHSCLPAGHCMRHSVAGHSFLSAGYCIHRSVAGLQSAHLSERHFRMCRRMKHCQHSVHHICYKFSLTFLLYFYSPFYKNYIGLYLKLCTMSISHKTYHMFFLQMKYSLLDFLCPSLIPELCSDIATCTAGYAHFILITVSAVRAFPYKFS